MSFHIADNTAGSQRFAVDNSGNTELGTATGQEMREIMQGAGATKAWAGQYSFGHLSGGTKMGEDPRLSVTNAFGRAHDIENLWVAGASLFPTNGAATPTFTVVALAHRIAADVIERS